MIPTISSLDTLALAGYVHYSPLLFEKLQHVFQTLQHGKDPFICTFRQILAESDLDASNNLANLSLDEVRVLVAERLGAANSKRLEMRHHEALVLDIGGQIFTCVPWSVRHGCQLTAESGLFRLHFRLTAPNQTQPNVYVEAGSIALWSQPWQEVAKSAQNLIESLGVQLCPPIISRFDIAFHTQALDRMALDHDLFSTRGRTQCEVKRQSLISDLETAIAASSDGNQSSLIDLCNKWRADCPDLYLWKKNYKPQQITFGRRGSRCIFTRIYAKSVEVAYNPIKKAFFRQLWGKAGFDLSKDVVNVEFEFCRELLREKTFITESGSFQILTVNDLIQHHAALSAYLIGTSERKGYIRMINLDSTRKDRCSTAERWQAINESLNLLRVPDIIKMSQVEHDLHPAQMKEMNKRIARSIVKILISQGREAQVAEFVENCDAPSVKDLVKVMADALIDYDEVCKNEGRPGLPYQFLVTAAKQKGLFKALAA